MAKGKTKPPKRKWMVVAPLTKMVVEATDIDAAVLAALDAFPHTKGKSWLAKDWDVHEATSDELREYAAHAEAHRKSQPTAKSAKRKTVHERLFLD